MSGKNVIQPDCSCYPQSHKPENCPPYQNVTHPLRYYEFTQDEIKVLEECDKESFYRRCLPFSTLFASLTYAAMKFGLLSKSQHFGVVPKILIAAFLGHVYGRLSFINECDALIREKLPNESHLGKTMRKYYDDQHCDSKKKK